jgi:hypothetical protein
MRKLLILAAVAALSAACHSRSEEEVGAAPDEGQTDTTAITHEIDSTRTGPPGVGGRPGDATVTPDSVGIDSAAVQQGDTGAGVEDTSLTSTPQDTLGPSDTGGGDTTGMTTDTTGMQHDPGMQHDTTGMTGDTSATDTTSSNQ